MDIYQMLDELEELVEKGSKIPFSSKTIINKEAILDLIDGMRVDLPEEMRQARRIMTERERVIEEAREEAQKIIEEGKARVQQLAQESEIVQKAQHQADEIINKANQVAMEIKEGANQYADDVLSRLEANLEKALAAIREGKKELRRGLQE